MRISSGELTGKRIVRLIRREHGGELRREVVDRLLHVALLQVHGVAIRGHAERRVLDIEERVLRRSPEIVGVRRRQARLRDPDHHRPERRRQRRRRRGHPLEQVRHEIGKVVGEGIVVRPADDARPARLLRRVRPYFQPRRVGERKPDHLHAARLVQEVDHAVGRGRRRRGRRGEERRRRDVHVALAAQVVVVDHLQRRVDDEGAAQVRQERRVLPFAARERAERIAVRIARLRIGDDSGDRQDLIAQRPVAAVEAVGGRRNRGAVRVDRQRAADREIPRRRRVWKARIPGPHPCPPGCCSRNVSRSSIVAPVPAFTCGPLVAVRGMNVIAFR